MRKLDMKKKFIVLDLDGTLLSDKKEIDKETLDYLKSLIINGHMVIFASGRRFDNVKSYAKQLFSDSSRAGYVICCDGCYTYNSTGNLLRTSPLLCGKDLQYIYSISKGESCNFRFYSLEEDYAIYEGKSLFKNTVKELIVGKRKVERVVHRVKAERLKTFNNIEKVVLERQKGCFSDKCCADLGEKYNFHRMSERRLEIQKKGINKAYAVSYLLEMTGYCWDDVLFFGDDANDHCMLDTGCTVVAMGNADDVMKKKANHLTRTNNEQGVLKALEMLDII